MHDVTIFFRPQWVGWMPGVRMCRKGGGERRGYIDRNIIPKIQYPISHSQKKPSTSLPLHQKKDNHICSPASSGAPNKFHSQPQSELAQPSGPSFTPCSAKCPPPPPKTSPREQSPPPPPVKTSSLAKPTRARTTPRTRPNPCPSRPRASVWWTTSSRCTRASRRWRG